MFPRRTLLAFTVLAVLSPSALYAQANAPGQVQASRPKRAPLLPAADSEFSEAVATQVLNVVRDGLHNHSAGHMLAAFDRDHMANYLAFDDQTNSFFNQYDSFRAYFHVLQATTEGQRGVALVDWQLEASTGSAVPPQRRQAQLRIEFAPGKKGWQIVELTPRNFFQ